MNTKDSRLAPWVFSIVLPRAQRKTRPASLETLVRDKYLAQAPLDPHTGAPLRFRATSDGIVIYFIGKNCVDEEGEMLRHFPTVSDDQGFRLWDEKHRAQPADEAETAK
jgi:hypothetical protein